MANILFLYSKSESLSAIITSNSIDFLVVFLSVLLLLLLLDCSDLIVSSNFLFRDANCSGVIYDDSHTSAYLAAICIVFLLFAAIVMGIVLSGFFKDAPFSLKYFPVKRIDDPLSLLSLTLHNLQSSRIPSSSIDTLSALFGYSIPYGCHHCKDHLGVAPAPVLNSNLPLDISCNVTACFAKSTILLY